MIYSDFLSLKKLKKIITHNWLGVAELWKHRKSSKSITYNYTNGGHVTPQTVGLEPSTLRNMPSGYLELGPV